jgi:hypothetical protein
MDRLPEEGELDPGPVADSESAGELAEANPEQSSVEQEIAGLSVAEQIRRQIRGETGEIKDPGLNLHLNMRGGGVELTDEAAQFKAESGKDFEPPPFQESEWKMPVLVETDESAGPMLRWVIIGGLTALLLAAGLMYGLPAYREYTTHKAEAAKAAELGDKPPLEAVPLDQAFYDGLDAAIKTANAAISKSGTKAYVYRYRVDEEVIANESQQLTLTLVAGGSNANKLATDHNAFDAAMQDWVTATRAHPGVQAEMKFEDGSTAAPPLEGDRYCRYGYDFGREHMSLLQPVIDRLESDRRSDGHYPRVLEAGVGEDSIRTYGGFGYIARGFGYLPTYATDSHGNIIMGTGESTLQRLTPKVVSGYYLFYYLEDPVRGVDAYGPAALDYYTRRIAPLPYDPGGSLHNVPLTPDGKPDGIACIVKSGKLLRDEEL